MASSSSVLSMLVGPVAAVLAARSSSAGATGSIDGTVGSYISISDVHTPHCSRGAKIWGTIFTQ